MLGVVLGTSDGVTLGVKVGSMVGMVLGSTDGVTLAVEVGSMVTAALGTIVSPTMTDEEELGIRDAAADGACEGAVVGYGDGATVNTVTLPPVTVTEPAQDSEP